MEKKLTEYWKLGKKWVLLQNQMFTIPEESSHIKSIFHWIALEWFYNNESEKNGVRLNGKMKEKNKNKNIAE